MSRPKPGTAHAHRIAVREHAWKSVEGLDLVQLMDRFDTDGISYKLRVETNHGALLYRGTVWDQRGGSGYGRFNTRTSRRDALAGAYARCVMQLVCGTAPGPQDEGEAVADD